MSTTHVFVDESKARNYLLAAVSLSEQELGLARRAISSLSIGAQRLHMKKESDRRRRLILSAIERLSPTVTIYVAGANYRTDLERRERCLRALVNDLSKGGLTNLRLERDESLLGRDRQQLIEATRESGCTDSLRYRHESASVQPLLALPDAIAWAWARGGNRRRRCQSDTWPCRRPRSP